MVGNDLKTYKYYISMSTNHLCTKTNKKYKSICHMKFRYDIWTSDQRALYTLFQIHIIIPVRETRTSFPPSPLNVSSPSEPIRKSSNSDPKTHST